MIGWLKCAGLYRTTLEISVLYCAFMCYPWWYLYMLFVMHISCIIYNLSPNKLKSGSDSIGVCDSQGSSMERWRKNILNLVAAEYFTSQKMSLPFNMVTHWHEGNCIAPSQYSEPKNIHLDWPVGVNTVPCCCPVSKWTRTNVPEIGIRISYISCTL